MATTPKFFPTIVGSCHRSGVNWRAFKQFLMTPFVWWELWSGCVFKRNRTWCPLPSKSRLENYFYKLLLYRNRVVSRRVCWKNGPGKSIYYACYVPGHHIFIPYTLPETNSSHLKIGHPKRKRVFQPSIFRGKLLVSGKVFIPLLQDVPFFLVPFFHLKNLDLTLHPT